MDNSEAQAQMDTNHRTHTSKAKYSTLYVIKGRQKIRKRIKIPVKSTSM